MSEYLNKTGFKHVWAGIKSRLANKVDVTRTINGKPLTSDITLTALDVGINPSGIVDQAKTYTDDEVSKALSEAKRYTDENSSSDTGGSVEAANVSYDVETSIKTIHQWFLELGLDDSQIELDPPHDVQTAIDILYPGLVALELGLSHWNAEQIVFDQDELIEMALTMNPEMSESDIEEMKALMPTEVQGAIDAMYYNLLNILSTLMRIEESVGSALDEVYESATQYTDDQLEPVWDTLNNLEGGGSGGTSGPIEIDAADVPYDSTFFVRLAQSVPGWPWAPGFDEETIAAMIPHNVQKAVDLSFQSIYELDQQLMALSAEQVKFDQDRLIEMALAMNPEMSESDIEELKAQMPTEVQGAIDNLYEGLFDTQYGMESMVEEVVGEAIQQMEPPAASDISYDLAEEARNEAGFFASNVQDAITDLLGHDMLIVQEFREIEEGLNEFTDELGAAMSSAVQQLAEILYSRCGHSAYSGRLDDSVEIVEGWYQLAETLESASEAAEGVVTFYIRPQETDGERSSGSIQLQFHHGGGVVPSTLTMIASNIHNSNITPAAFRVCRRADWINATKHTYYLDMYCAGNLIEKHSNIVYDITVDHRACPQTLEWRTNEAILPVALDTNRIDERVHEVVSALGNISQEG